jgi:hypothetical protein
MEQTTSPSEVAHAEVLCAGALSYAFYKYVPALTAVLFTIFVAVGMGVVPFAFIGIPMAALVYAYGTQFKRVNLLDTCLLVSDKRHHAHVPVGQITRIKKTFGNNPPVVMVVLRSPSVFGRRFLFIPRSQSPLFTLQEDPIVVRLRQMREAHPDALCTHDVRHAP